MASNGTNKGNELATYRIGFILEQTLGHATHSQNLQTHVPKDLSIDAHWGLLGWKTTGFTRHVPLYNNWTVRAGLRARKMIAAIDGRVGLDALFFHTQVPAVLSSRWMRRIPSVVSLDATPLQYDRLGEFYGHATAPLWLERWKWHYHRACFHEAQHIITWSQWTKRSLVDEYDIPTKKITVIPPGIHAQQWTSHTPRQRQSGVIKILFVGGDLQRKGGLLLIEAFRRLRRMSLYEMGGVKVEVQLHMVTQTKVPQEPGLFVYNDMQPNSTSLKQLYFNSDIFCLPTYGDCLPMVVSEAGASGLPVVSTRLAAIPEIVQDGETGFLLPAGNAQALIATLKRLASNPDLRLQMGERARAVVRQHFDAERNTSRLLEVLKYVVDEARNKTK
jgi:glycosyltransferase involved in cell wall biosynthesis